MHAFLLNLIKALHDFRRDFDKKKFISDFQFIVLREKFNADFTNWITLKEHKISKWILKMIMIILILIYFKL